jgi:hypothetical protein
LGVVMVIAIFINTVSQFARPPEHQERRVPACLHIVDWKQSNPTWLKTQECIPPLGTRINKGSKRSDLLGDPISHVLSISQITADGPFRVY